MGGAAAAGAAPAKRSWMGPIAGLAAGLGLAALMSHLGMGEAFANFLMMALLAVALFFVIRLVMPQLTEERRRELVKQAKSKGEDAKVSVRNVRRRAMEELHRIKKDGEAGEDEVGRAEKDLDKSTAQYVHQIEELVKHKEGELLEV